jgi:hypothetical protein
MLEAGPDWRLGLAGVWAGLEAGLGWIWVALRWSLYSWAGLGRGCSGFADMCWAGPGMGWAALGLP